jgi:hypothetical protein
MSFNTTQPIQSASLKGRTVYAPSASEHGCCREVTGAQRTRRRCNRLIVLVTSDPESATSETTEIVSNFA